jgi:hypothetical protein
MVAAHDQRALDGSQQVVGQHGDEQVGPGPVIAMMSNRAQTQV